ncbi:MAG: sugar phosphate isomerase/epimerase family protein [Pseudomonadota bacterium]
MKKPQLTPRQEAILAQVRVNAPAAMLHEGLLEKFLAAGIRPEVGLDARALTEIPRDRLRAMAREFKNAGLKTSVHGPFMDLSPGALDPEILATSRRRYDQGLEAAALFEPEHIVFHPIYDPARQWSYRERWLEISLETWRPAAQKARDLGIRLVLENTHETDPRDMEALFSELAPLGVGFCLDLGHAHAVGRVPLADWVDVLGPHLAAMHLHDNCGDRDEHLAVGRGGVDFAGIFSRLVKTGVRPRAVTLEPHAEEDLWPSLVALAEVWPWDLPE